MADPIEINLNTTDLPAPEAESSGKIVLPKPVEETSNSASWVKTLVSLALYIAAYYFVFDGKWDFILLLVLVVFIHELGHFIAMKLFGYKDVGMFFVPFLGAFVSGEAQNLSQRNRVVVLLAGPVPGILLGLVGWWLLQNGQLDYSWKKACLIFVLLNGVNLLPVSPMDGGQIVETLFLQKSRTILIGFYILSIAFLLYFSKADWVGIVFSILLLIRIGFLIRVKKIQDKLQANGLDLEQSYDDLTDEEYTDIRYEILVKNASTFGNYDLYETHIREERLIPHVKAVLLPPIDRDLKSWQKLTIVMLNLSLIFLVIAVWKRWI
jgi:stage IV sporulation protein FB